MTLNRVILFVVALASLGAQARTSSDEWFLAATEGNTAKLKAMLAEGVPVDRRGVEGETALIAAASSGHSKAVTLLLSAGTDIEARDEKGLTALINAAGMGYLDVVRVLLDARADPNASAREGVSPLTAAAVGGPHLGILRALLHAGADIDGLLTFLAHRESVVRVKIAMALASLGSDAKSAVPKLAKALADNNLNVRWWVAKALRDLGPEARAAVPHLIEALETHPTRSPGLEGPFRYYADVRWMAADALGEIGLPLAVPALRQALNDENPQVRAAASEALDKIQGSPSRSNDTSDERSLSKVSSSDGADVIPAGPLPPRPETSSSPFIVRKSVAWMERRGTLVVYTWQAVVHNPGTTALRVVLDLRLHDTAGEVLYQTEHNIELVGPGGQVVLHGEGEVEQEMASRADHWTLAIVRFDTVGSR